MQRIAKRFGLLTVGIAAGVIPGCQQQDVFRCSADDECRIETIQGFCEPNRYCSFPAADCDSERRYGGQAGGGLAGECVPVESAGSTTDTTTTESTSSGTTQPEPPMSSSTTGLDDTDDDTTGLATTRGPGSGDTSTGRGESTGGPMIEMWTDDFDRPDSLSLGNGWVERSPGTFALVQGRVTFAGLPMAFQDSVFYRPFDEVLLELDLSIEFTHVGPFDFSTPQLHARIQEDSLGPMKESLNAYIVYLSQPDELRLSRIEGDTFALTGTEPIDPPLAAGNTYRLSLRVAGTDPVELIGRVEGLEGGVWNPIQTVLLTDSDETRIIEPGSFGASGSNTVTFDYDNFSVIGAPL